MAQENWPHQTPEAQGYAIERIFHWTPDLQRERDLLIEQAQHGPDRLKKPGAGSDRDLSARPDRWGAGRPLRQIFLEGILLGVSVSSSFMRIKVQVSTFLNPFEDLYKKCSLSALYVQSAIIWIYVFVGCSLYLTHILCISIICVYLTVVFPDNRLCTLCCISFHTYSFVWYQSARARRILWCRQSELTQIWRVRSKD